MERKYRRKAFLDRLNTEQTIGKLDSITSVPNELDKREDVNRDADMPKADRIENRGITCPRCGSHYFRADCAENGLFICANELRGKGNGICGTVVSCICKRCGKEKTQDRLGKHGDVYECKDCGQVQWGYTDYMREQEEINKTIREAELFLKSLNRDREDLERRFRF